MRIYLSFGWHVFVSSQNDKRKISYLVLGYFFCLDGDACFNIVCNFLSMKPQIHTLQKNILSRYQQHWRTLPRRKTRDPYAIHISEVMLQQTQVDRVIPYFLQWMKDFPGYVTLAKASKAQLLKHRSGLWFNSRALRLRECAKVIKPPKSPSNGDLNNLRNYLMKLPGIGPYTSAAIMAFAWNLPVPVIDTNIRRVLIFLFKLPENIGAQALEEFAEKIIPKGKSRDWHNALMDYGALELTARKTKIKPLSKQSKFEWSDRQVRGWILKYLVKNTFCTIKTIQEEFPKKEVKMIVAWMAKDGLITMRKWRILIAE